jgi:transcriptional regulator with XRE-family HTH domain
MMQDSLARNLRVLRAERGLNLTEASKLSGVTIDTISTLEHGERGAYTSTLYKLAEAYGVTLGDLLGEFSLVPAGKAEAPKTGRSAALEPYLRVPHGSGERSEARRESRAKVVRFINEAEERGELDPRDVVFGFTDDAVELYHISDQEKDPVYGPWVTFTRQYTDMWRKKAEDRAFDMGEYDQFIAVLDLLGPILGDLGLREREERGDEDYHSTHGPVMQWAIRRITDLFEPMAIALKEMSEGDELERLRRERDEFAELESGLGRVANG